MKEVHALEVSEKKTRIILKRLREGLPEDWWVLATRPFNQDSSFAFFMLLQFGRKLELNPAKSVLRVIFHSELDRVDVQELATKHKILFFNIGQLGTGFRGTEYHSASSILADKIGIVDTNWLQLLDDVDKNDITTENKARGFWGRLISFPSLFRGASISHGIMALYDDDVRYQEKQRQCFYDALTFWKWRLAMLRHGDNHLPEPKQLDRFNVENIRQGVKGGEIVIVTDNICRPDVSFGYWLFCQTLGGSVRLPKVVQVRPELVKDFDATELEKRGVILLGIGTGQYGRYPASAMAKEAGMVGQEKRKNDDCTVIILNNLAKHPDVPLFNGAQLMLKDPTATAKSLNVFWNWLIAAISDQITAVKEVRERAKVEVITLPAHTKANVPARLCLVCQVPKASAVQSAKAARFELNRRPDGGNQQVVDVERHDGSFQITINTSRQTPLVSLRMVAAYVRAGEIVRKKLRVSVDFDMLISAGIIPEAPAVYVDKRKQRGKHSPEWAMILNRPGSNPRQPLPLVGPEERFTLIKRALENKPPRVECDQNGCSRQSCPFYQFGLPACCHRQGRSFQKKR